MHPRAAHGIDIQVAQQAGRRRLRAAAGVASAGTATRLDLIEHHVGDLDGAVRLFRDVLDGHLDAADAGTAELTWPGGSGSGWCARTACRWAARCTTSGSPAWRARSAPGTASARTCWPGLGLTVELAPGALAF